MDLQDKNLYELFLFYGGRFYNFFLRFTISKFKIFKIFKLCANKKYYAPYLKIQLLHSSIIRLILPQLMATYPLLFGGEAWISPILGVPFSVIQPWQTKTIFCFVEFTYKYNTNCGTTRSIYIATTTKQQPSQHQID